MLSVCRQCFQVYTCIMYFVFFDLCIFVAVEVDNNFTTNGNRITRCRTFLYLWLCYCTLK